MIEQQCGAFYRDIAAEISSLREAGLFKTERPLLTPQAGRIEARANGATSWFVNLCSNNYLGLSNHPEIVSAAVEGLGRWGFGMSSVRFICGTQDVHKELEARIAGFLGYEDSILFPSCFDANAGFFEVFFGEGDHIISDRLNHASIIDGIRLTKAKRSLYDNCDLEQLEDRLRDAVGARRRIIVTDGVFSMDGVIAPLPGICDLAERYGALVYVDDSHGIGVIGETGRGAIEYHGVASRVDFVAGTLGKALGGASGGFVAGRSEAIAMLRQRARPYLFSNSVAPPIVAASLTAFDILEREPERLLVLSRNMRAMREGLLKLGFAVLGADHAIIPVWTGEASLNQHLAEAVQKLGIYVTPFSYPVVPHGSARIRLQVSAAHSQDDIAAALAAFSLAGIETGITT